MRNLLSTILFCVFSLIGYSQNSKIDSVKSTYYDCLPDSLGIMYTYSKEVEFETCSENKCRSYTKRYNYSQDTLLTEYQTELILASTKERVSLYWWQDESPRYQEVELTYEKFFEGTKTYFYVEVWLEIFQWKSVPVGDTVLAQNIQSRRLYNYEPEPFYLSDVDTTSIKATVHVKTIQFDKYGAISVTSEIAPEFEQHAKDSIIGRSELDLSAIRSLAVHRMQELNDLNLTREREVELDTNAVLKRFVALPEKLYSETDKKRPSHIKKRNKRYNRTEKGKNQEVWVLGEDSCEHVIYEVYTRPKK